MVDMKIGAATQQALASQSSSPKAFREARSEHQRKYRNLGADNRRSDAGQDYADSIVEYDAVLRDATSTSSEMRERLSPNERSALKQELQNVEDSRVPAQVGSLLDGDRFTSNKSSKVNDGFDASTDVYAQSGSKSYRQGASMEDVKSGNAVFREGDKQGGSTEFQSMLKKAGYDVGPEGADGFQGPNTWKGARAWMKDAGFEGDVVTGEMLKDLEARGTSQSSGDAVETYHADKRILGDRNYADGREPGQVAGMEEAITTAFNGDEKGFDRASANVVGRAADNAALTLQGDSIESRTGHENVSDAGATLRSAIDSGDYKAINTFMTNGTPQEVRRATELLGGSGRFEDIPGVAGDNQDYRDALATASRGAETHLSDSDAKSVATKIRNASDLFNDDERALDEVLTLDDDTLRRVDAEVKAQGKPAGVSQMVVETTRPGAHRDLLMKRLEKIGGGERAYNEYVNETFGNGSDIGGA